MLRGGLVAFRSGSSRRSRTPATSDLPRRTAMVTSNPGEHQQRRLVAPLQDTRAVMEYTVDLSSHARAVVAMDLWNMSCKSIHFVLYVKCSSAMADASVPTSVGARVEKEAREAETGGARPRRRPQARPSCCQRSRIGQSGCNRNMSLPCPHSARSPVLIHARTQS